MIILQTSKTHTENLIKVVQHLQQRLNLLSFSMTTVAHPVQQLLQSATIKKWAKAKF